MMNNNNKNDNTINELLKNAHNEIEPPDSWQALRDRIDHRIDSKKSISVPIAGNIFFWRRLAFGMAACFLITAGILLYLIGVHHGTQEYHQQVAAVNNLLGQADLNRLSFAFSQVRQLFGQQSQWIMVGSGDNTQMGVADRVVSGADSSKIIIVRLAVNLDDVGSPQQYYDIVTYSDQKADLQLPLANASTLKIGVRPVINNDGTIIVETDAYVNGTSQSKSKCAIADDSFTPLVNMRVNGNWIRIDGVGRLALADGELI